MLFHRVVLGKEARFADVVEISIKDAQAVVAELNDTLTEHVFGTLYTARDGNMVKLLANAIKDGQVTIVTVKGDEWHLAALDDTLAFRIHNDLCR